MATEYDWICVGKTDRSCTRTKPCETTSEDEPKTCVDYPTYAELWDIKPDR